MKNKVKEILELIKDKERERERSFLIVRGVMMERLLLDNTEVSNLVRVMGNEK